ncbi:MAG: hypothetical protein RL385_805 [Pseudomonadota bacterium]|jgi:hypothetical protein
MRWPIPCLILSAALCVAQPGPAEASPDSAVHIGEVELITSWHDDPSIERSLIESFKELLRRHGYHTDDCQENREAWQRMAHRVVSTDDMAQLEELDARVVAAEKCTIPPSAVRAYDVKLVLDYDPVLKSRRAVLHLIALGEHPNIDGGYAHKPGALVGWYDLMNRAIERALQGYNDATAVRVSVPQEAEVGETVQINASDSWDPDGEAFELRWDVTHEACVQGDDVLPLDKRDCPTGMVPAPVHVRSQAGGADGVREFTVPMIGDYTLRVHAKIGAREEPAQTFQVRAYPRRKYTFHARVGVVRLPKFFLNDDPRNELAIIQGLGILRRFVHRLGFLGWYEEIHYGFSFNPLRALSPYGGEDGSVALLYGFDIVGRTMNRTGRYGLTSTASMSAIQAAALRDGHARTEWGWVVSALMGFYYAFGENYRAENVAFCQSVCPGLSVGPTLTSFNNFASDRVGISFGGEFGVGLEF